MSNLIFFDTPSTKEWRNMGGPRVSCGDVPPGGCARGGGQRAGTRAPPSRSLQTCIDGGFQDMEFVSKIRLYGASTNSTADTGVDVLQNYKIDADGLDHIQADRDAKMQLPRPRLGETCDRPNGIPYRNHPKAVMRTEVNASGDTGADSIE